MNEAIIEAYWCTCVNNPTIQVKHIFLYKKKKNKTKNKRRTRVEREQWKWKTSLEQWMYVQSLAPIAYKFVRITLTYLLKLGLNIFSISINMNYVPLKFLLYMIAVSFLFFPIIRFIWPYCLYLVLSDDIYKN